MVGGVANSVHELVKRLRARSHEVSVITAGLGNYGLDGYVWRVRSFWRIEKDWGDVIFCPSIYKVFGKTTFDVVHAHTPRKLFPEAVAVYKLLSKRKFPYIVSIRLLNTSLTGLWRALSHVYQHLIERGFFRYAEYIVVQTEANKQFLLQHYGTEEDKIHIIPNGIDTTLFNPEHFRRKEIKRKMGVEDKSIVLFAGRLTAQKGAQYLLHAIPKVEKSVPDVKFLIAGDGPLNEFLKSEVRRLGIDSSVIFLGKIEHDLMPEFYSAADAFVLPSLSESFPNTMLEAMAMEKPLVVTRVGVIPEILEDYKTAILVEPANSAQLANALVEVLTNRDLSGRLAQRAGELVRKKYTWERVVDRTLDLYEKVVN